MASRFDDIDLPSAVKYLIASDPNLQVLGAAYLQHKCYSDSNAKKQVSTQEAKEKGAVPSPSAMLGHPREGGGDRGSPKPQPNGRAAGRLNPAGLSPPRPAASRPCPSW